MQAFFVQCGKPVNIRMTFPYAMRNTMNFMILIVYARPVMAVSSPIQPIE
jgi:hypothetical protein